MDWHLHYDGLRLEYDHEMPLLVHSLQGQEGREDAPGGAGTCTWSAPNAGFVYNDNYEWNIHVFWPDGSGGSGFGRPLHFSP